jgi:hypothetical protein
MVHEIKLDGFRVAARSDNGRVQLLTRTGLDWTDKYPGAITALAKVNVKTAYIDGELWGVDEARLPSFAQTQAATDGERGAHLVYYAFDLLHVGGWDVSSLPLTERKGLLKPLVANKPGLQFNSHETGDGELILKHTGKLGFEGVVSKTIDAPYAPGIAAYGVRPNGSTARCSSLSAGRTRKARGLISARRYWATIAMTVSSSMPAAWARACPSRFSPICGAASTRWPASIATERSATAHDALLDRRSFCLGCIGSSQSLLRRSPI